MAARASAVELVLRWYRRDLDRGVVLPVPVMGSDVEPEPGLAPDRCSRAACRSFLLRRLRSGEGLGLPAAAVGDQGRCPDSEGQKVEGDTDDAIEDGRVDGVKLESTQLGERETVDSVEERDETGEKDDAVDGVGDVERRSCCMCMWWLLVPWCKQNSGNCSAASGLPGCRCPCPAATCSAAFPAIASAMVLAQLWRPCT
jgi:hypothetical protein